MKEKYFFLYICIFRSEFHLHQTNEIKNKNRYYIKQTESHEK